MTCNTHFNPTRACTLTQISDTNEAVTQLQLWWGLRDWSSACFRVWAEIKMPLWRSQCLFHVSRCYFVDMSDRRRPSDHLKVISALLLGSFKLILELLFELRTLNRRMTLNREHFSFLSLHVDGAKQWCFLFSTTKLHQHSHLWYHLSS